MRYKSKRKFIKGKFSKLIYLILAGYLLKSVFSLFQKKDKIKEIEENIKGFLNEEKREIKELATRRENFDKFCCDSGSLLKEYFIPHEGNDHKPKFLRSKSLIAVVLLTVFLKFGLVGYLFLAYPEGARMSEVIVSRIIELTNIDRTREKLSLLKINPALTKSAQSKADNLVSAGYFAHTSPDGRKPWDFIDRNEYRYLFVGENLAMNFTTADSAHRALMNSPTHQKNILNDRYEDVGMAMASGLINGKQTNVLVEHFGTTKTALAVAPVIAGVSPSPAPVKTQPAEPLVEVAGEEQTRTISEPAETEKTGLPPVPPSPPEPTTLDDKPADPETGAAVTDVGPREGSELMQGAPPEEAKLAQANVSPNYIIDNNQLTEVIKMENIADNKLVFTNRIVRTVNYVIFGIMMLMIAALLVNIVIRVRVQHKPIIIQAILVILFIGSLVYFRIHTLESGVVDILLI